MPVRWPLVRGRRVTQFGVEMPVKSNRQAVQLSLCIAVFLVPFMGSSLNLAMPMIADNFEMSAFFQTFLVSSYLLGTAMFQMPAARLGDLFGRRRLFLLGLSTFGLFTFLSGVSWSGWSLVAFRFASGVGSAMVFATNMAILTAVFPKEERGKALGVNTAVVYLAVAIGPTLGGLFAQHLGWRSIFYVCFALSVVAVLAAVGSIKDEWAEAAGEPLDVKGSVAYAIAVGGVVCGFTFLPHTVGWVLLVLGVGAAAVFVKFEHIVRFPMVRLELFFNNRHFRLSSLSAMINYSASFAIGFTMSLYLQFVKGMPADSAGFLLMAQPAAQTLLSPLAGRLSDKTNPSCLTTSGMAAIALGLLALSTLRRDTPVWLVVAILVLVGVGVALFSSPNVNIIMGSVSSRDSGVASATTGTARQIGQALSMSMTSLIVHAYMGEHKLTPQTADMFLPAMNTAFLIFVGISCVGIYTSASKLFGDGKGKNDWRYVSARFIRKEDKGGKRQSGRQ